MPCIGQPGSVKIVAVACVGVDSPFQCLQYRGMATSEILEVWRSGATERLHDLLSPAAVFSSPYADYDGRTKASHLLRLVGATLEEVQPSTTWGNETQTLTTFTAKVSGDPLDGVILEMHGDGALTHVTLFLRPFASLRLAMRQMVERLDRDPVPET